MKNLLKGTTVDTNNLQSGELIHMEFAFYNMTSIRGLTYMLTVVCIKTRMLWVFPTVSKQSPVFIIHFILTTYKNEKKTCKHVRVDEYGDLANSIDVNNLVVENFNISTETTSVDASWLNGNNER